MASYNGLPVYKIKVNESLESKEGIDMISLVDFPAIESNWVAMSKEKKFSFNQDKQLLYGAILIPDQPIYRYSKEMGEYYVVFTKEEIVKLVRKFQAQQKTINLNYQHKEGTQLTNAVIQEIWLVEQPDKSNKYVEGLPDGSAFVVAHIGDSEFWNKEVKSGNVRGFSIEGWLDMELKSIKNKMEKFVEATTKDGVVIKSDAEAMAVGVDVYTEDEAGNKTPVADGTYEMDNGMVVAVAEGKITEISEPTEQEAIDPEVEALLSKIFEKHFSAFRTEIEEKFEAFKAEYSTTPGAKAATEKSEQPVQMSAMDKLKEVLTKKSK